MSITQVPSGKTPKAQQELELDDCKEFSPNDLTAARSLLDQLLADSKLYTHSKSYFELLAFIGRLRNFAPFNAMLLHVQKPGISYAASARDWRERFGRTIKENARPLLILWPFGPVAMVYDQLDTEGQALPEDASAFHVRGNMDPVILEECLQRCRHGRIKIEFMDKGDFAAGYIRIKDSESDEAVAQYSMCINRNHSVSVQFVTLAHELGHLFLGHLGPNRPLRIPSRLGLTLDQREFEAESVAYMVGLRHGVAPKSHTYLSKYVAADASLEQFDLYPILRAAGQVETLLKLGAPTRYDKPLATPVGATKGTPEQGAEPVPDTRLKDFLPSLPKGSQLVGMRRPDGAVLDLG